MLKAEEEFVEPSGHRLESRSLPPVLRALRHRNYRYYVFGQVVSHTGTWVQSTALQWLVFAILTQSSSALGLFNFLAQIPVLFLGLFAGAMADTVNRHRIILVAQTCFMLSTGILAFLTLGSDASGSPLIRYEHVLALALFNGIVIAFDLPARQAFLPELVPRPDLPNAVALNSLIFNGARIIGPAIAVNLIAYFQKLIPDKRAVGEGICFAINAFSFLVVLLSLLRMGKFPSPEPRAEGSRSAYLVEGIRYLARTPHLSALHIYVGIIAIFALPYLMLTAVFAKEALHGDSTTYGAMTSCIGAGAILGGACLANRANIQGLGLVMVVSTAGFSFMILALANTRITWVACLLVGLAGFFMVIAMIAGQTLLQTLVATEVRGRVMSLYTMLNVGLMPFGSLLSGTLAERFGVGTTLMLNGGVCLLAVVYFAIRLPSLRASARQSEEYQQAMVHAGM